MRQSWAIHWTAERRIVRTAHSQKWGTFEHILNGLRGNCIFVEMRYSQAVTWQKISVNSYYEFLPEECAVAAQICGL